MSQFVVDDQLAVIHVLEPLRKWLKARRLQELRPGEIIRDERVPEILMTLPQPTFVTIDHAFGNRDLCHPRYAVLFFDLTTNDQERLPEYLRALLRKPEFATRAARMGKVVRVHPDGIEFWEHGKPKRVELEW